MKMSGFRIKCHYLNQWRPSSLTHIYVSNLLEYRNHNKNHRRNEVKSNLLRLVSWIRYLHGVNDHTQNLYFPPCHSSRILIRTYYSCMSRAFKNMKQSVCPYQMFLFYMYSEQWYSFHFWKAHEDEISEKLTKMSYLNGQHLSNLFATVP